MNHSRCTGSMASEAAPAATAAAVEAAERFDGCISTDEAAAAANVGYTCFSPRISFSTDFAQLDRVSSPNRRTSAAEYSTEFEFCCLSAEESMLLSSSAPADEIFFNGKLLPLHLVPIKELLLLEEGSNAPSAGQSCESSACPSPFRQSTVLGSQQEDDGAFSPPRPTPTCIGSWRQLLGLGRKPRKYHFKLVKLFFSKERGLGDSVKAASSSGGDSPVDGSLREKHLSTSSATDRRDSLHLSPAATSTGPQGSEKLLLLVDGGPGEENDPGSPGTASTPAGEGDNEIGGGSPEEHCNTAVDDSLSTEITSSPQAGSSFSRRGNSGRIMLKNLERCTRNCIATRSSSSKQQLQQQVDSAVGAPVSGGAAAAATGATSGGVGEKQVSGPFSSRVAPVLNVPMCMDPVKEAKTTMTGLRRLLSGKKPGGSLHRVSWTCPGGAL